MRLYWSYSEQSSHEGYVDMYFKEISDNPKSGAVVWDSEQLYGLICSGYVYMGVNHNIPRWMDRITDYEGDLKEAKVSKRLLKKWCDNALSDDKAELNREWATFEKRWSVFEEEL